MNSSRTTAPWIRELGDGTLSISVSTAIYPLPSVFRTCYIFTDRCYLFLEPEESGDIVQVSFAQKNQDTELHDIAGQFCNELINQRLRFDIAAETRPIRELIVAQAFAEAEFAQAPTSESANTDNCEEIAN
jgi:His-Xaa-Ser system protein HxsD